jgi:hypothetical protein
VGSILVEEQTRFPEQIRERIPELAEISLRLRRDRDLAFDGDRDFIPEQVYGREAAAQALAGAERVLDVTRFFIGAD